MRFMRKHSKKNSNKLMSSCQNSLSERQAVLSSFKEISLKESIATDNSYSHEIDNSSKMTISSFRDSACSFKFARLKHSRVNSSIGNKGLMRREFFNIPYLGKENSSCNITDTVNRSDNLHLFNSDRLTEFRQNVGDVIQLFHKVKECRDFLRQDKLFSEAIGSDRAFCSLNNLISADRDLSALAAPIKRLCNNLSIRGSDQAGRGEFLKEQEHCSGKYITDGLQFREGSLQNPLNLIFSGSNKMADGFTLSCNISEVFSILRVRGLLDRILMDKDELSDSEGVFFVSFGFTQREFCEIGNQNWINNDRIDTFVGQIGEEIDMVASCGLHDSHDRVEVFTVRSNSLQQVGETAFIHSGRQRKAKIAFGIKSCGRERILGNINTDKQFSHNNTSLKSYSDKAGEASRPILHVDKGSKTQSTYYGFGRQGTDSVKGSLTQVECSSPACPSLTGKTRLYKFYNTYY